MHISPASICVRRRLGGELEAVRIVMGDPEGAVFSYRPVPGSSVR
ncbi:hypothetical protein GMO_27270 [Gluconobacter morbifer G707]|uniref:Uncharacterized protein n=1 Tax=Gluconobacter morbifer G707 TaxID=1088869 RepID=G6XMK9_9PROT|nr:hypothetical protein GMO_27270 [Gluconobacter morbifer G707]